MTPVIPCSLSNISFVPGAAFTARKINSSTRCGFSRKNTKQSLSTQRFMLPLSTSIRSFPAYGRQCMLNHRSQIPVLSATGTDVAVEEQDSPLGRENSSEDSKIQSNIDEESESSKAGPALTQSQRTRSGRKSEMPPVKNEELVSGATFTGKVRAIQPFGAFVDFGAFTDGLVHVSRLSDSFVKDVSSVVSIGQEVKVRLVEVNFEAARISLSMRETDEPTKRQPSGDNKPRTARKNGSKAAQKEDVKKTSKFVKGQDLEGTVKKLTRSGAFISLPEGEDGFLPTSEEADDGLGSMMGGSSLQVGQEVKVRVLRITRGNVTLTMKKEEDDEKFDGRLNQGVVHVATNPFVLAFRKNKDIAAFLDKREEEAENEAADKELGPAVLEVKENVVFTENEKEVTGETTAADVNQSTEDSVAGSEEGDEALVSSEEITNLVVLSESPEDDEAVVAEAQAEMEPAVSQVEENLTSKHEKEESSETAESNLSSFAEGLTAGTEGGDEASDLSEEITDRVVLSENPKDDEAVAEEAQADDSNSIAKDDVTTETSVSAAGNEEERKVPEENGGIATSEAQADVPFINDAKNECDENPSPLDSAADQIPSSETQLSEDIEQKEVVAEAEAAPAEVPASVDKEEETSSQGNGKPTDSNSGSSDRSVKATVSPSLVKQLREETGAGMMDCKKALSETGGDIAKAQEYLRKKGLASADKKASRATAEGRIGSYIHDGRIGVLLEVNCETDFVSRGDIFKELVDDLAMQVAACPQVQYLVTEDVPETLVKKEKEIEMQKEDLLSKPEQIRERIVEGRIRKRLEELALLEQSYIKNDKVVVKEWVKQTIATVGENIKVKRFVRYNLGEGLEKKSQDFAAEVAAQTTAKPKTSEPETEQPKAEEAKETVEKRATVAISAALVKQLREETGAGMMDCKKALSETRGDIEKAQEYLRKKGLSSADKKSSRLAAEGRIGSYIHDSRIGVLIEVNCETDFVGRSEKFKELVDDLAMQAVACPQVQYVSIEDIPEDTVKKEKEIEMQREDILSKPENIRERIVGGRVSKRLGELALLEQPFIKDDNVLVKDLVKQRVAALGENIRVRRFVKFTLGEDCN